MAEATPETTQSSSPQKGMNPMMYTLIAIVILLVIGGGYYLNNKAMAPTTQQTPSDKQLTTNETPTSEMSTTVTQTASSPSATTANETDITVTGSNFKLDPAAISVKKGQKVKITFTNTGGEHNFVLDGYNVKTQVISSGQTRTVEFVADKTGTFQYYCSVGSHRALGMQGTLTVQ